MCRFDWTIRPIRGIGTWWARVAIIIIVPKQAVVISDRNTACGLTSGNAKGSSGKQQDQTG